MADGRVRLAGSILSCRGLLRTDTLEAVVSYTDFPSYASIAVPCLVLTGEHDPQATPAFARACAAEIPNARFALVANAGHIANLEQPEVFNGAVFDFLSACEDAVPE